MTERTNRVLAGIGSPSRPRRGPMEHRPAPRWRGAYAYPGRSVSPQDWRGPPGRSGQGRGGRTCPARRRGGRRRDRCAPRAGRGDLRPALADWTEAGMPYTGSIHVLDDAPVSVHGSRRSISIHPVALTGPRRCGRAPQERSVSMTFDSLGLAPEYLRAVADEGYT